MEQSRWKSWALWSAVLGEAVSIMALTGLLEKVGLTSETAAGVIAAIGQILGLFGIVNNPTSRETL